MNDTREIILTRDCPAVQIPSGNTFNLEKGARIHVTQTLGGSFTVMCDYGLARIDGEHADAIGMEISAEPAQESPAAGTSQEGPPDEEAVWTQLRNVYDPEIPVNIVDLGLVYSLDIKPSESGEAYRVEVMMTLTAPGCGMGPAIAADARSKVLQVPGVEEADVDLVWEPAWNQGMISEEGRMILGLV
ncbi:MAG: putative Fe-S cluster assembly protein SufT [Verrucomicrobia bacterium]|nr:MAG: putative Fe-S cluster assembly protein SufT [Verrucomicrobiota bacterium]